MSLKVNSVGLLLCDFDTVHSFSVEFSTRDRLHMCKVGVTPKRVVMPGRRDVLCLWSAPLGQ